MIETDYMIWQHQRDRMMLELDRFIYQSRIGAPSVLDAIGVKTYTEKDIPEYEEPIIQWNGPVASFTPAGIQMAKQLLT